MRPVIVDQFMVSAEEKWHRLSGNTPSCPTGSGRGRASSARLERFLELAVNDNIQIVSPTTPAQYYPRCGLGGRRWRKPLVIMTPKACCVTRRSSRR